MDERLTIGQLAQRFGLNTSAIRYYEANGARVLLQSADAGTPAFEALRELATDKLPEVEALIERAQAMRSWLLTATDCSCTSLDVCALFDREREPANGSGGPVRLHVTHAGGAGRVGAA